MTDTPKPLSAEAVYLMRQYVSVDGWLSLENIDKLFATITDLQRQLAEAKAIARGEGGMHHSVTWNDAVVHVAHAIEAAARTAKDKP